MNETMSTLFDTPFSVIRDEVLLILNDLHFLRAEWFYAFIPLIIYLFLYNSRTSSDKNWVSVVDQKLLPFVLSNGCARKRRRYPLVLIFIAGSLCITALAGPVYKKLPQPVYREQSALVVLLDLSASMNAADIKPSRLARAKLKLLDILKTRKTGQTALIVYAADAFVVTPLTDDNATIANLVPALETEMMPAQGSNLSIALVKTFSLFSQAGIIRGDVLVITDGIREKYESAIEKVSSQGHRLSILGVGTTAGGPIPLLDSKSGGFMLDDDGAIIIPKLQPEKLQRFALEGSGIYTELKVGDGDVLRLTRLFESKDIAETSKKDTSADIWREEGHWLLLPLLLFAAVWARKGWIAVLLPFTLMSLIATPQSAHAEAEAGKTDTAITSAMDNERSLLDTENLWSSPDQKAMKAFNEGDNKKAAEHFTRTDWKASALYRSGDYQGAVEALKNVNDGDGYYNKANALAKLGQFQQAIKAYDRALEHDPDNTDAKYNRELVEKALKEQQQQSQQENSQQEGSDEDSDKQDQRQSQQQNQDNSKPQNDQDQNDQNQNNKDNEKQESGEQNDSDQQSQQNESKSEQDNQSQQDKQPPTEEQKKSAEEQELKQRDAEQEKEQQQQEQQEYAKQQKEQQQEEDGQQKSDSVENKESEDKDGEENPLEIEVNPTEASITEDEKATEQWLKRVPDDPGGLLRRKFLYQYKRTPNQTDSDEPW